MKKISARAPNQRFNNKIKKLGLSQFLHYCSYFYESREVNTVKVNADLRVDPLIDGIYLRPQRLRVEVQVTLFRCLTEFIKFRVQHP